MNSRQAIAAAASTEDGIEVTPYYELVSAAGQGYVERTRTEFPNRFGGEDYWGVIVCVPQELKAAQAWIDENQARIVSALGEAMVVTLAQPQLIPMQDNQSIRALVVEGHREAEE